MTGLWTTSIRRSGRIRLIAGLLVEEMVRLGDVHPGPGWVAQRDRLYRENLDSLDDFYYLMGQKRWATFGSGPRDEAT